MNKFGSRSHLNISTKKPGALLAMGAGAGAKSPVSKTSIVPAVPVQSKKLQLKSRRKVPNIQVKKILEPIQEPPNEASKMKQMEGELSPILESETELSDEIDLEECQLYHVCYVQP